MTTEQTVAPAKVTVQLVARAVSRVYEEGFRKKPEERPLMSAFRNGIDAEGCYF